MYLDKPMRDHVLLQAIARVNRPYVDANGVQKRVGLVVDFVGVLRELKKALQFDSSDVSGVIEDLDLLLKDLLDKIAKATADYLEVDGGGSADERLEKLVYGRFLDPEPRKTFFEAYKEIEALWEILSPSAELRDHITTYKRLAQLYAAVRNAYAETRRLRRRPCLQDPPARREERRAGGAGTHHQDRHVRRQDPGGDARERRAPTKARSINLVRGLRREIDEERRSLLPCSQTLRERADSVLQDLEDRRTTGLAAMDRLAVIAAEKDRALKEAQQSGLSDPCFGVYWALRDDVALKAKGISAMDLAARPTASLAAFPMPASTAMSCGGSERPSTGPCFASKPASGLAS